jgi:hypothetical protein
MRMSEDKWSSIRVKKSTAQQLSEIGRKSESYDDIIVWLLKNSKKRKSGYMTTEYKPNIRTRQRETGTPS